MMKIISFLFSKKAVEQVAQTGRICVLDVDKQGVKNIRKTDLHPLFIYISPPSYEILEKRLRARKTDNEAAIEKRLKESKESMEFSKQPGVYDHIISNDKLDVAYNDLKEVLRPVRRICNLQPDYSLEYFRILKRFYNTKKRIRHEIQILCSILSPIDRFFDE